jgi:hypothetical protein
LACDLAALPHRRAVPAGQTIIRFASSELEARDGAIASLLGDSHSSTTAWLEEWLRLHRWTFNAIASVSVLFVRHRLERIGSREVSLRFGVVAQRPGAIEIVSESVEIGDPVS